ncbi:hypothetical protein TcasGA2_TC034443 [Tribolium castaneum]|uniref:Uncharacterized protein n=1 Tax=Tribolium castaneum TaxID=7070 RepID=A0A139WBU1_TRICA|nr:hypothetical protein TcasGA2_TC034443 [Tribolium castaneum]
MKYSIRPNSKGAKSNCYSAWVVVVCQKPYRTSVSTRSGRVAHQPNRCLPISGTVVIPTAPFSSHGVGTSRSFSPPPLRRSTWDTADTPATINTPITPEGGLKATKNLTVSCLFLTHNNCTVHTKYWFENSCRSSILNFLEFFKFGFFVNSSALVVSGRNFCGLGGGTSPWTALPPPPPRAESLNGGLGPPELVAVPGSTRASPDPVRVCAAESGGEVVGEGSALRGALFGFVPQLRSYKRSAAFRKPCSK